MRLEVAFMELDKREIYYVYEWYNVDNGEIFYVGKGRGHRCCDKSPADRNKSFIEYINNNNCTYRKILENVNEETACKFEDKRIKELKALGLCSCNLVDRTTHRGCLYGSDNGFFGKKHSDESRKKMSEANSGGRNAGENNSQFGVSPKERMSEQVYSRWLFKQQQNKNGEMNGRATNIIAYNEKEQINFTCITYCAKFIKEKNGLTAKLDSIRSRISECIRCGYQFCGYFFEMKDDKFTYNKKEKFNVDIEESTFNVVTKKSKESGVYLSILIKSLIEKYVNSNLKLVSAENGSNHQKKTIRLDKTLCDKFDLKRGKYSRSFVINSLIKLYLEGGINFES